MDTITKEQREAVNELVKYAQDEALVAEDLDELTHEVASKIASSCNNAGVAEQIGFLVRELGPVESVKAVKGIKSGGR